MDLSILETHGSSDPPPNKLIIWYFVVSSIAKTPYEPFHEKTYYLVKIFDSYIF